MNIYSLQGSDRHPEGRAIPYGRWMDSLTVDDGNSYGSRSRYLRRKFPFFNKKPQRSSAASERMPTAKGPSIILFGCPNAATHYCLFSDVKLPVMTRIITVFS